MKTEVANRGSVITGSSVHNARIECLWRDLRRIVVRPFANLFYYMEDCSLLDPMNDTQLSALHYIYQPRINLSLREFTLQYNHHPLTVQNQSPFQIFHEGVLQFSSHSGSRGIVEGQVPDTLYGIDEEAPIPAPQPGHDDDIVEVVSPRNPLPQDD